MNHKSIQIPSVSIIFSVISVLVSIAFAINMLFMYHQNKNLLASELDALHQKVEDSFQYSIEDLNERFGLLIAHYTQMPEITKAIEQKNRDKLQRLVEADYQTLKQQEPNLYVMHFFDTKNVTILRMHKPESYNDDLTDIRPIVDEVNRTKTQMSGFEPGKNGITYRITTPVFNPQHHHIGVLEFGVRPAYFSERLKQRNDVAVRTLVKTTSLKSLTYQTHFKQINDYSVVMSDPIFNQLSIDHQHSKQVIENDDGVYLVLSNIFLNSYDDRPILQFQIIKNISGSYAEYKRNNQMYITLSLATYAFFLLFLYVVFQRFQNNLHQAIELLRNSERHRRKVTDMSLKDELTQAFNRRYFNQVMDELYSGGELKETPYSMVFFDIDHFKQVNDTHGHLIGDEVLIELTKEIKSHFRDGDQLFRWGGEEFFALLADTPLSQAISIAERFRVSVQNSHRWPENIHLTISLSVVQLNQNESPESMQHRLDELLYEAKASGRNQVKHESLKY